MSTFLERCTEVIAPALPWMLAFAILPWLAVWAWRRTPISRLRLSRVGACLVIAALLGGTYFAIQTASLFDDAYISFRYAQNLVDGHGLVFNPGERVEGYTNFLWTVVIAGLLKLTTVEAPWIGLVLSLLAYVACVLVVYRLGRALAALRPGVPYLPIAAVLLAVQNVFTDFATTGLETMAATLLMVCGVYFLVHIEKRARALLAGLSLILSTLMRPDHGLFYAVGAGVLLVEQGLALLRQRRERAHVAWWPALRPLLLYAVPFALYAAYLTWKLNYYGSIVPNTYYAKSADLPYYSQGVVYLLVFLSGSHMWLVLPMIAIWALIPTPAGAARRFKWFTVAAILVFSGYVVRVGGDFMAGRFFVVLLPLLLLGAEQLVYRLASSSSSSGSRARALPTALVAASLLCCTARGVRLIPPRQVLWRLSDEGSYYRVKWDYPIAIASGKYTDGKRLGKLARDGIQVPIATTAIGLVGYYSHQPLVDMMGLTDPVVAHQPLQKRARPGHEKSASMEYLRERGVRFVRPLNEKELHPKEFLRISKLPIGAPRPWYILSYDRELMRRIQRLAPGFRFTDFEQYLDRYIAELATRDRARVRRDLLWFRSYYFDHNDDRERLAAIEAYARP